MPLLSTIKLASKTMSEGKQIRQELERGKTGTLGELEKNGESGRFTWPKEWWLDTWLRRKLRTGFVEGVVILAAVLLSLPLVLAAAFVWFALERDASTEAYAIHSFLGGLNAFPMTVMPLICLRSLFKKIERIMEAIVYSFENGLVEAPAFVSRFRPDQVSSINEMFSRQFFKPRVLGCLQGWCNVAYSRKCQAAIFLVMYFAALAAIQFTVPAHTYPKAMALYEYYLRSFQMPFVWGIIGVFLWSIAGSYLLSLTLVWTVNLIKIPQYRPLFVHYRSSSSLFSSMFVYLGSILGLGSIWLTVWALLGGGRYDPRLATLVSVASFTSFVLIVGVGMCETNQAMEDHKRRRLDVLESALDREQDPERYRIIRGEYRTALRDSTWPVAKTSIIKIAVIWPFSVISSQLETLIEWVR